VTGQLGGSSLGHHLNFTPRLAEARWLRDRISLHAMIDVSDGLAQDAQHLAEESGVAIELWEEAIPVSAAAAVVAETGEGTALEHALHDGEDYELLFTAPAREASALLQRTDLPVPVTCIGEVVAGSGLWIRKKGRPRRPLEPRGWRHEL
jgi:thiamine-monophosphate kinase